MGYDGTNRVNDIFLAEQLGELRCPFLSRERYEKSRFVGEEGKEIKNSMQQRKVYLQKAPKWSAFTLPLPTPSGCEPTSYWNRLSHWGAFPVSKTQDRLLNFYTKGRENLYLKRWQSHSFPALHHCREPSDWDPVTPIPPGKNTRPLLQMSTSSKEENGLQFSIGHSRSSPHIQPMNSMVGQRNEQHIKKIFLLTDFRKRERKGERETLICCFT